jgi:hypothetical protein
VKEYLSTPADNIVILRHDVDRKPQLALQIAEIEHRHNIHATYYFRTVKDVFKPEIIRQIASMGHEIGYHYEAMDKAGGDANKAIEIFQEELEMMRKITPIHTICMHGNPLKPWSNKDLWQHYNYQDYGIIGEAYLSLDFTKVAYFTDTGRSWNNPKYSVKDIINQKQVRIKNTDQLIQIIKNEMYPQICILTHPNRWSAKKSEWTVELVSQNIKNIVKRGINIWGSKKLH